MGKQGEVAERTLRQWLYYFAGRPRQLVPVGVHWRSKEKVNAALRSASYYELVAFMRRFFWCWSEGGGNEIGEVFSSSLRAASGWPLSFVPLCDGALIQCFWERYENGHFAASLAACDQSFMFMQAFGPPRYLRSFLESILPPVYRERWDQFQPLPALCSN